MSELPELPPGLMTLEQWDALEVAHTRRWELSEGTIIMSPRPQLTHQRISKRLTRLLDDHLPDGLEALPEIEVTTSASFPPSVRDPDIVVINSDTVPGRTVRVSPADVALVVEIVSPGSRGMDHVMKLYEYAKAGIEHYWIVDAEAPTGEWFLAYRLDGEVYRPVAVLDGEQVQVREPVVMEFTLEALLGG
ncbi:Uma2 family endonuclease [Mycolicibacter icosiumassiliensis]|uniref:Uma2 family endonuclease n=1 Tax=Mycolicibacter icosiumassiliensis TaxID=1792835 RepID=UPI000836BF51|nr:Uma2 family endonuclease [Mycolicibacter icosiumassiliensis]